MADPDVDTSSRKALLQYLVRMGSFTSSHKMLNDDTADNDVELPKSVTWDDLRIRCEEELAYRPPRIQRRFRNVCNQNGYESNQTTDCIRVLQWNVLSQALAISSDNFVACPMEALNWKMRRWRILEEILSVKPDILCLQEVDHYQFFKRTLEALGFGGVFFPKPDSPCYYIVGNNGPDGCAVFFNSSKYELIETKTRSLEVWGYQSNQVAILCHMKRKLDGKEFFVATTHLKARQGPLLATMRFEQGKDLLDFVKLHTGKHPVIVTGDFNAGPTEPVYKAMMSDEQMPMDSAYRHLSNRLVEPPYTTWKIREEGECCQTLDYIFFSKKSFALHSVLELPTGEDIGEGRVPSYTYPSDHFSLVSDFRFATD